LSIASTHIDSPDFVINLNGTAPEYAYTFTPDGGNTGQVAPGDTLEFPDTAVEATAGAAFVVTSTERAKDLRQPPVLIRGAAQGASFDQEVMTSFYRETISHFFWYNFFITVTIV
jgi:hypothetical protein